MADRESTQERAPRRAPLSYGSLFVGLRYLLKKKLSYLATLGVALSVGVIIVVMSVFTGFHRELTAAIRGWLSDMKVKPMGAGMYAMDDWELLRRRVLELDRIRGAAPFIEGAGLLRQPATGRMFHIMFRGVDPELEGSASDLPEYMESGSLDDLERVYPTADGGRLKACFVGHEFFGFVPAALQSRPRELVLVTVTPDLRRALARLAINGVFKTGNAEYDSNFVVLGLETAADLVDSGDSVSGLNVRLSDYRDAEGVRSKLAELLRPGLTLRTFSGAASTMALSGDGRVLALQNPAGEVVVHDAAGRRESVRLPPGRGASALALDAPGERLFVGRPDGTGALFETMSGRSLLGIAQGASPVATACFSPQGYLLALAREDGALDVFDAEGGEALATFPPRGGGVRDLSFDGTGERLVAVRADGQARLYEAETGREGRSFRDPEGVGLTTAAFSPDRRTLVAGCEDGRLLVWEIGAGGPIVSVPTGHEAGVMKARFGWTSEIVLSAGADGLRAWHLRRTAAGAAAWQRFEVPARDSSWSAVAFGTDGARGAALGPDGTARLLYTGPGFEVRTWKEERKTFLEAIETERFLQGLIMSLILVLAEFFIFAIITTMVYEKRRDIGILKAVGFTRGQICLVFLTCGLAIGLVGALLGVGGGLLFADNINAVRDFIRQVIHWDPFPQNIYYFTEIPTHVGFLTPAVTAGGAVICSLLFSLVPALRAARMDPVQTLHHE
ncbi:MAG: FtsX-like permease family protein [Candidatus Brocadiaceae bacterium]|jgi:ABC-type lipoprotein release transport system permease subunit